MVLKAHCITHLKWRQSLRVFRPALVVTPVPAPERSVAGLKGFAPRWMGTVLTREDRYEVPYRTTKYALRR